MGIHRFKLVVMSALIAFVHLVAVPSSAAEDSPPLNPQVLIKPVVAYRATDAQLFEVAHQLPVSGIITGTFWGSDAADLATRNGRVVGTELGRRGARQWAKVLREKLPTDFTGWTDEQMLILAMGLPAADSGKDVDLPQEARSRYNAAILNAIIRPSPVCDVALYRCNLPVLTDLPDDALARLLRSEALQNKHFGVAGFNLERILIEVIRRGKGFEKELIAAVKRAGDTGQVDEEPTKLLLLTALRRIQKQPDPISITLTDQLALEWTFPTLPSIAVALHNGDVEQQNIPFSQGGDYRSGRQARWRFEVTDDKGHPMPLRDHPIGHTGGGLLTFDILRPGEDWKTTLAMPSFVPALPPGEYVVRILYHDSVAIADQTDVSGLIIFKSEPIKLRVTAPVVELKPDKRAAIRALLDGIDTKGPLKIIGGVYDTWAHDLVPPTSSQGQLLTTGLPAVPVLLDALNEPDLTTKRRAVILSCLYTLTGQHDPREAEGDVTGGYSAVNGPWQVWGDGGGGFGSEGSETTSGSKIDEAAQKAFAKFWEPWKNYIKVVDGNGPPR